MTVLARRYAQRVDDDDEDINDFDPAYFPRKVYKDGRGPRVRLMLTDSAPPQRRTLFDARNHRPHFAEITDAAANRRAVESYEAHKRWFQDAWKTPGQMQQSPDNSDPDGDEDDDTTLSPRDEYVRRTSNMWREPIGNGNGNGADAIEAQRRRWTREGGGGGRAPSSVTFGAHNPSAFPSRDAASLKDARALADAAYAEMVDRLSNAWRR